MNIWANLYRHHRWSNLTLIEFLSGLTDEQLQYTSPGVYGDALATIRHIVSSDADYVRIIPDTPDDIPQTGDEGPFEGWDELRRVANAADSALIEYVDGLTEDAFFVDIDDGEAFDLTTSFLLSQIIHHATSTAARSERCSPRAVSSRRRFRCGRGGRATRDRRSWTRCARRAKGQDG